MAMTVKPAKMIIRCSKATSIPKAAPGFCAWMKLRKPGLRFSSPGWVASWPSCSSPFSAEGANLGPEYRSVATTQTFDT
jgi:hypothetical protein